MNETPPEAAIFDRERPRLLGLAYRLTGSWADAEDLVSESWFRWSEHAATVREPAAWLTTVISRQAVDLLRSARVRRESYVGPWLPEPLLRGVDGRSLVATDPSLVVELDESVRTAMLLVLDELSAEQRVAFVLHDALQMPFAQIAEILRCSTDSARQQASRGRRKVREARLPERSDPAENAALLDRLAGALATGDAATLATLLAPDVVLISDGAGEVFAARRRLVGAEVGNFLLGLGARMATPGLTVEPVLINGDVGALMRAPGAVRGQPSIGTYAFDVDNGVITTVYAVVAPAKLARYQRDPGAEGRSH